MKKQNLQEIRSLVPGFLGRLLEFLAEGLGDGKTDLFLSDLFGFSRILAGRGLRLGDGRLRQRYRGRLARSFASYLGCGCRFSNCFGRFFR